MRTTRKAAPRPAVCPDRIDRERRAYVAAIAQARAAGGPPGALLDKASSLLTTHWIKADWTSRAAILKSVDWLLRVATRHPAAEARPRQEPLRAAPR